MCIGFSFVFFVIVGSVCVFRVVVLVVVVIVALALAFFYPSWCLGFLGLSWLVGVFRVRVPCLMSLFIFNLRVENPNPYSVSIISSSVTVSYDDGVTVSL